MARPSHRRTLGIDHEGLLLGDRCAYADASVGPPAVRPPSAARIFGARERWGGVEGARVRADRAIAPLRVGSGWRGRRFAPPPADARRYLEQQTARVDGGAGQRNVRRYEPHGRIPLRCGVSLHDRFTIDAGISAWSMSCLRCIHRAIVTYWRPEVRAGRSRVAKKGVGKNGAVKTFESCQEIFSLRKVSSHTLFGG